MSTNQSIATKTNLAVTTTLTVNGRSHALTVEPWRSLLDLLREDLHLTGSKKGCDHGQCGACTVLVDGIRVNSCLCLAVMHDGATVTTIEGIGSENNLSALQQAFVDHDSYQCGYCTPGQICSAVGMLKPHGGPKPRLGANVIAKSRTGLEPPARNESGVPEPLRPDNAPGATSRTRPGERKIKQESDMRPLKTLWDLKLPLLVSAAVTVLGVLMSFRLTDQYQSILESSMVSASTVIVSEFVWGSGPCIASECVLGQPSQPSCAVPEVRARDRSELNIGTATGGSN